MKELGTALAVLALYVVTLLAPLHQAAALQRHLDHLGFAALGQWMICAEASTAHGGPDLPTAAKCPATALGKFELAMLAPPPAPALDGPVLGPHGRFAMRPAAPMAARPPHLGQPRAPPVTV